MTDVDVVELLEAQVALAVAGDRVALGKVLELVQPRLRRYCAARLGNLDVSADDVVQDVCLALVTAVPKYRDMGRPFMAFVFGIASHKLADAGRRATVRRAYSLEAVTDELVSEETPEDRVLETELQSHAQALMDTLSPQHRKIILMRVVWGMTAPETGRALNMTAGAVRVAQHRALNNLRSELTNFSLLCA